jgi:zinc/manganese transport system substrate-binding protein
MKITFNRILFSSLVFVVAGSVSPALAKTRIVTTLPSFADIATQVGGDEVSAVALTKGTQDPHFVDAKPDLILQLNRADLLIRAGLGLEDGWLPPLLTGARNGKIQAGGAGDMDASALVELKEVPQGKLDRAAGDVHPGGNPHFMLDPRNGVRIARGIAERLGKIDPEHAPDFKRRAEDYVKKLEAQIALWSKTYLPMLKGKPVVTYHKSWIYFTSWAGLSEVEHVEPKPGIPPSPAHVVRLIGTIKQLHAKMIIMEPFYPKGVAEDIAGKSGAKLLVLPAEVNGTPDAKSYLEVFETIFKILKGAL